MVRWRRAVVSAAATMRDPDEGLSESGMIVTGARRERVPPAFEPVVEAAGDHVRDRGRCRGSLYLYGSVATGAAQVGVADVDLLTVGLARNDAEAIGLELSVAFTGVCRAVEVAVADPHDYVGDGDEEYGNRVFLRHYCVHLAGPDDRVSLPDFPGDARAARGFNGDLARHAQLWREALDRGDDAGALGRRIARKTLLAVAGLVSVHDHGWTTDRMLAARRWSEIQPATAAGLRALVRWVDRDEVPTEAKVRAALDGIVVVTTQSFADSIGLWDQL